MRPTFSVGRHADVDLAGARPARRTASRGRCPGRGRGRPSRDAARTVIAPAWPWATRFVPSSGSTAMSIAGTSSRSSPVRPTSLADVQHRRLVALALADDDRAGELDLVHRPAHRLGRRAGRPRPVAAAHEPGGRDRRRLGDPDHLEREQLFHQRSLTAHRGSRRAARQHARRACSMPKLAPRPADRRAHQCRKWRRPVKTIARWWRSATSIAISSRIEPPGWMIAVTPALAAIWMPSGNGK